MKKIGWDRNPWGVKVKLSKKLEAKNFTYDARKLAKQKKVKDWVKKVSYCQKNFKINPNTKARLVKPDGKVSEVYMVFNNYEKLLNWNRSLRFAITIGIFADLLSNV